MKAYNQKIIDTPTYAEIYEYDTVIRPKQKRAETTIDPERKEKLPWLYETDADPTTKRTYEELSAEGQYDSLKRKQKYYKNQRFEISRVIDTNFDEQTKFLTLTFQENIQDIEYTNTEFKKFIKRLNYQIYRTKKARLKYLATWEKQQRGAIHYHLILFSFPYVPFDHLAKIWGHGFVSINQIDVDSIENRGRYLSKYFDKDLELKEHKKKSFFKSRNLKLPKVTKRLVDEPFDTTGREILYENTYTVLRPFFTKGPNEDGISDQIIDFEECLVHYKKLKKT